MDATPDGSLQSLRSSNRGRLLDLLQDNGVLHRAELARRAGVSRTTVSSIVADLLAEGLVLEVRADSSDVDAAGRPGRTRSGIALNPRAGAVIGLDFSANAVMGVIADLRHEVIAELSREIAGDLPWSRLLDVGVDVIGDLVGRADLELPQVLGIGLGVPGPVDHRSGEVGASSRSIPWTGVRAATELESRVSVPVKIGNTAHLGALAEVTWGAAQGSRNVVYVKVSSGVSAGLIMDGALFGGSLGAAGGLGHMPIELGGPVCPCGGRGCLELYAAVPALIDRLQAIVSGDLTLDRLVALADGGNRATRRVLADAACTLGRAIAGICNVLNPELVVIGGDITVAGDHYFNPLERTLREYALPLACDQLRLRPGQLGDKAGALGAVALALRETSPLGARAA